MLFLLQRFEHGIGVFGSELATSFTQRDLHELERFASYLGGIIYAAGFRGARASI